MRGHRLVISLAIFSFLFGLIILQADVPSYRIQRYFFAGVLSPMQQLFGYEVPDRGLPFYGFHFESAQALTELRRVAKLDDVVVSAGAKNDFEVAVALMHWVRDRYAHGEPEESVPAQSFNGLALLQNSKITKVFCGQLSQLLVQAVTAMGGYARRVELRFTPDDQHAVVEVWSTHLNKWAVLDPDYDIYYTAKGLPLNALDLHRVWRTGLFKDIEVKSRESQNGIFERPPAGMDSTLIRRVFTEKNWRLWDRDVAGTDANYHAKARFSVKLLNYYGYLSYPMRNDWQSRPLKWWHPEGNHVQNSLVLQSPDMPKYEDFLLRTNSPGPFYLPPLNSL